MDWKKEVMGLQLWKWVIVAIAIVVSIPVGNAIISSPEISQEAYEAKREEVTTNPTSVNARLAQAYNDACCDAVERWQMRNGQDDLEVEESFLYCTANEGMYFFCKFGEKYYCYKVYGGNAVGTYLYILYNTYQPPADKMPDTDSFVFTITDGNHITDA